MSDSEVTLEDVRKNGFREMARRVQEARNVEWDDAWDEYGQTTLIDIAIGKIKRAKNTLLADAPNRTVSELVDAYNYLRYLKERMEVRNNYEKSG